QLPSVCGALALQVFRKAMNVGRPADGMLLEVPLLQLPNGFPPVELGKEFCRMLIPSWRVSFVQLKSPIFHSLKAIVLLVPSVMSRMRKAPGVPMAQIRKIPVGLPTAQGRQLGPTEAQ